MKPQNKTQPIGKNSDTGSALVLVLLITALLTTITVSFLSTSRIEMMAARNFSRQSAASGLAEMATQQAMAQIQKGFTVNGTDTAVITTQPGAIRQFVFSGGSVTSNTTTELFSGASGSNATTNGTANLNNLQNPGNTTALTSNSTNNQWTITGNASERINVPIENITSNGTIIGRIAYYVDDEGTKLNLNAATGNRTTLNVGSSRSLSLSSLAPAQANDFTDVVNGNATTNSTSDIKNWAHFFRPEQITGAVSGFTRGNIPKLSAAPVAGSDYHLKKTPWGTDRLFINDLPIDSTGVDDIYNALSSSQLRDIYGTTFAEKYTDAGLKQIAANILQARDPNVLNDWNKSFTYNGSLLGAANATTDLVAIADCCDTANATKVIPKDYLGNAPYPMLNEIGVTVVYGVSAGGGNTWHDMRLMIRPYFSILNPWRVPFPKSEVDNWEIQYQIDSFRVYVWYEFFANGGNRVRKHTYGPQGFDILGDSWGHTYEERESNLDARDIAYGVNAQENYTIGTWFTSYSLNGTNSYERDYSGAQLLTSFSEELSPGEELQFPCPPIPSNPNGEDLPSTWENSFQLRLPENALIKEIKNIVVKFEYIRLLAKSRDGTTIRDWILGKDLEVDGWLQAPHPTKGWADGFPKNVDLRNIPVTFAGYTKILPPPYSVKRLDGRLKTAANMRATQRSSMKPWSVNGTDSWPDGGASGNYSKIDNYDRPAAFPSNTANNEIPGDRIRSEGITFLKDAYDPGAQHLNSNDWPKIQFTNPANGTGIFTAPADLGKIQTNVLHRKLRFTTQHPREVALVNGGLGNATYIPDWAMLDVISFGSNVTAVPLPAPVNLNGRFHVPSGSPQPAPRTAGLESALKAIDSANSLGNSFNANNTVPIDDRAQYVGSSGNASTVAGHIGNLTWSTANFTSGSATWGKGNSTNDPGSRRKTAKFPTNQIVLPSEVTEIMSVSDVVRLDSPASHIKRNEGRLSSLFPGATTQSRFFTIYAYAQALDKAGTPDSEAVTKTLVEVIENTSTTPSTYTVKKLYTQPISVQ